MVSSVCVSNTLRINKERMERNFFTEIILKRRKYIPLLLADFSTLYEVCLKKKKENHGWKEQIVKLEKINISIDEYLYNFSFIAY